MRSLRFGEECFEGRLRKYDRGQTWDKEEEEEEEIQKKSTLKFSEDTYFSY